MYTYKIANIYLSCSDQINLPSWKRFLDVSTHGDVTITVFNLNYNKYNFEIYPLIDEADLVIRYFREIMIVNKKWTQINILPIVEYANIHTFLIQVFYANAIMQHMIQIHSSLIEYQKKGLMFLGPSGIGKTTQAELWHRYLDALIINGDMVFVEDKGDKFIGWGTPWHGSSPYCENTSVSIVALIVLKQERENVLRKLDGMEKVISVTKQLFLPNWVENGTEMALNVLDHLLQKVPVYELTNKADEESVELVKQEIFGDE